MQINVKGIFDNVSFEKIVAESYKSKGRYSVKIFYWLTAPIHRKTQLMDIRHYNTDNEREEYINQSISSYGKLVQKYGGHISAIQVDKHFLNIDRLNINLTLNN